MSQRILPVPVDLRFEASGELVEDLESLCRGVMGAERWPIFLEAADNDELLTTLLGDAVILQTMYKPRDGILARPWLFQRLRWKARDWRESWSRHQTLPELPRLDGLDELEEWTDTGRDRQTGAGGSGSHGAPGEVAGDRGDPGLDALRGLLESGDRALLREIAALGLGPPPGARGSTPDARRRLARLERQRLQRVERARARERRPESIAA